MLQNKLNFSPQMNKTLKIFLKIIAVIALIVVIMFGGFWISLKLKRNEIAKEAEAKNRECDTIKVITQFPEFTLNGFNSKDVEKVKFQIIRNNQIIRDTISTKYEYISDDGYFRKMSIPYPSLLRTDTVVVTINEKLKYYISDFKFSAHELYGMMGPAAVSDCELEKHYTINSVREEDKILPYTYMLGKSKNEQARFLKLSDEDFKKSLQTHKINLEQATKIFDNVKIDKSYNDNFLIGIRVEPKSTYYLFQEYHAYDKLLQPIYTIDADTGKLKKYQNFPFN